MLLEWQAEVSNVETYYPHANNRKSLIDDDCDKSGERKLPPNIVSHGM